MVRFSPMINVNLYVVAIACGAIALRATVAPHATVARGAIVPFCSPQIPALAL
jgi:hypothetical protein